MHFCGKQQHARRPATTVAVTRKTFDPRRGTERQQHTSTAKQHGLTCVSVEPSRRMDLWTSSPALVCLTTPNQEGFCRGARPASCPLGCNLEGSRGPTDTTTSPFIAFFNPSL
ncbi:hypothetical protein DPEC_G00195150 [Dallia pectoralis]|uniref:Uncharacterized protein n=1 Tax=Dallia pectoralis TaxID=75939 RepID=A0ACC2G7C4_DALPE|nr:hypothetical protein DPEC_G00195150 [Dallia pectoralis]